MTKPTNLLPCPFCGGEAEIERYGNQRQSTKYSCTECGCVLETPETFGYGTTWNRRQNQINDDLVKALKSWQEWWEVPWDSKRPDVADLAYMRGRNVLEKAEKNES